MQSLEIKGKSLQVEQLIRNMLNILEDIGFPMNSFGNRTKVRIAEATLAVADIRTSFAEAKSIDDKHFLTTRQIIDFENKYLDGNYSSGSYDDIRRVHLNYLTTAGYIVNSSAINAQSTNNPTRGYALSTPFAELLRAYNSNNWENALTLFKEKNDELKLILAHKRDIEKIPVKLPSGTEILLSYGEHNQLQRDIVQVFLHRFGFGAEILYIGDTINKFLIREDAKLKELGFFELEHEELPDIVAYSNEKKLLYLIEAVHSFGQMNELRVMKLKAKLKNCKVDVVFVSAFENKKTFRRFADDIAWESEVWIADSPDHMIHFNGYKFLEIHK